MDKSETTIVTDVTDETDTTDTTVTFDQHTPPQIPCEQAADCEQSELNSKWIKGIKSECVRSCVPIMMVAGGNRRSPVIGVFLLVACICPFRCVVRTSVHSEIRALNIPFYLRPVYRL